MTKFLMRAPSESVPPCPIRFDALTRPLRATLATALLVLTASAASAQECPSVDALKQYKPPEATRVFAMDGSLIADLSPQRRVVLQLHEIPPSVTNGFVAVEDRRFWEHDGVDVRGAGRAVWRNITSLSMAEGFSTITMQLARNVFPEELPRDDKYRRKMCEMKLAGAIEEAIGKREVLRMYINMVYMGDGKYGVEEASRGYFGKTAARLTLAEAALIVGLVKNPNGYNPRRNPAAALARRNVVLDVFAREKVATAADVAKAKREPVRVSPPLDAAGAAPYFVAAVRRELRARFGEDAAEAGLRVYTGLDPVIQKSARDAMVAQIRKIEGGEFGRWRHAKPDSGKLAGAPAAGSQYLQGMSIVIDARSGQIRALVGGRDFTHSSYDRAFQARRQPGSTFKPIVYAAALQAGLSPAAWIETTPVSIQGIGTAAWKPDDLVPDSVTRLMVRDALVLSSNNGAARVGEWVGVDKVAQMGKALGLSTSIPPYPSIVLGSAEVIPAELVGAYATIGNGGHRVKPTLITRIEDARGNVKWRAPVDTTTVLDERVAYLTTSILNDVIDRGTGAAVRRAGFWLPAAGKTGTTNSARDVWFVGMTPDLAAAVWLGFDQPKEILPNAFGGNLVAPIWAEIMKAAYIKRPAPVAWTAPASLITLAIDSKSGLLASADCPPADVRIEYFIPGTEPVDYCRH